MKKIMFLMLGIGCSNVFSQELSELINYFKKNIKEQQINVAQFAAFTKPFGKWDVRLLEKPFIIIPEKEDTIGSKQLPNIVWGAVTNHSYNLSLDEALRYPNNFLAEGFYNKSHYVNDLFPKKKAILMDIVNSIRKSDHTIFVQQKRMPYHGYERVDNVYRENNEYWSYVIPEDSPFQLSMVQNTTVKHQYSLHDEYLLKKLGESECYCVTRIGEYVVFMTGGFIDNSIGFIYSTKTLHANSLGDLYDLFVIESAGDDFYFYVSR